MLPCYSGELSATIIAKHMNEYVMKGEIGESREISDNSIKIKEKSLLKLVRCFRY